MAKRILIADDSDLFRDLMARYLDGHGFELLHAANGAKAIELAIRHQPDAILLDVQMPVMDGVEALRALRAEARTRHIPVVVISSIRNHSDQRFLHEAGAVSVLAKPVQAHEVWRSIEPHVT